MSNPGSDTASLAHCRRRAKRPFFHLSGLLVGGGEHGSRFALDEGPCVEASRRDPPVRLNFHQLVTLVRRSATAVCFIGLADWWDEWLMVEAFRDAGMSASIAFEGGTFERCSGWRVLAAHRT